MMTDTKFYTIAILTTSRRLSNMVTWFLVQSCIKQWFQVHLGDLGGRVLNKIKSDKN